MEQTTRARLARVVLALGLAGVLALTLQALPKEQRLLLIVRDDCPGPVSLHAVLRQRGEDMGGLERQLASTPADVSYTARVPNGAYDLLVEVSAMQRDPLTRHHSLALDGNLVRVYVSCQ
jgi:hypothetical protein